MSNIVWRLFSIAWLKNWSCDCLSFFHNTHSDSLYALHFNSFRNGSRAKSRKWNLLGTYLTAIVTCWAQEWRWMSYQDSLFETITYTAVMIPLVVILYCFKSTSFMEYFGVSSLLLVPILLEFINSLSLPYSGGLLVSIVYVLFGSSIPFRHAAEMTLLSVALYPISGHWLHHKDSPKYSLKLEILAYCALAVLYVGALHVAWILELITRQSYNAAVTLSFAKEHAALEALKTDGIIESHLPISTTKNLMKLRGDNDCAGFKKSLSRLAPSSRHFVERRLVTTVSLRVINWSLMLKDATSGNTATLALLRTFMKELDLCRTRSGGAKVVSWGSSTYTVCMGMSTSKGSAALDAAAAVNFACDAVALGKAVGFEVCTGVASGSAVGGAVLTKPLSYDLIGQVMAAACTLAGAGSGGQVLLEDRTALLLEPEDTPSLARSSCRGDIGSVNDPPRIFELPDPISRSWWKSSRQDIVCAAMLNGDSVAAPSTFSESFNYVTTTSSEAFLDLENPVMPIARLAEEKDGSRIPNECSILTKDIFLSLLQSYAVDDTMSALTDGLDSIFNGSLIGSKGTPCGTLFGHPLKEFLPQNYDDFSEMQCTNRYCLQLLPPSLNWNFHKFLTKFFASVPLEVYLALALLLASFVLYSWPTWHIFALVLLTIGAIIIGAVLHFPINRHLTWLWLSRKAAVETDSRGTVSNSSVHVRQNISRLSCGPSLFDVMYVCVGVAMLIICAEGEEEGVLLGPSTGAVVALLMIFPLCTAARFSSSVFVLVPLGLCLMIVTKGDARRIAVAAVLSALPFVLFIKWQIEYLAMSLYLCIQGPLAEATSTYLQQHRETKVAIASCLPHPSLALTLGPKGLYYCESASVVHVITRSALQLQGLVPPVDLCIFLNKVISLLDGVTKRYGGFKGKVSGNAYVAIFGVPLGSNEKMRPLEHVRAALEMVRLVQREVAQFSAKHRLSLGLSMGVAHGPITLGFLGSDRQYDFAAFGEPMAVATALASVSEVASVHVAAPTVDAARCVVASTDAALAASRARLAASLAAATADSWRQDKQQERIISNNQGLRPGVREGDIGESWATGLQFEEVEGGISMTNGENMPAQIRVWRLHVRDGETGVDAGLMFHREPTLNNFEVVRLLGTGGYGNVFLVKERRSGGARAVKVVRKARLEGITDWMRVELRVLARIRHPNVVQFEYCLQSEGCIYVVMEYIRGCTLKSLMRGYKSQGGLPIASLRFWFAELALALGYVHALGVIHRDVKPDNLMITRDGHLKLMDFGLAKVSEQAVAGGTVQTPHSISTAMDMHLEEALDATLRFLPSETLPLMRRLMPYSGADDMDNIDSIEVDELDKSRKKPMRILLVDKDPSSRRITKSVLQDAGYKVAVASNASQALKSLLGGLHSRVDLVLLDPVGSSERGAESSLLKDMQVRSSLRIIPVVILSSLDRTADVAQSLAAGAKEYIVKPLDVASAQLLLAYGLQRRAAAKIKNSIRVSPGVSAADEQPSSLSVDTIELFPKVIGEGQTKDVTTGKLLRKTMGSMLHGLVGGRKVNWSGMTGRAIPEITVAEGHLEIRRSTFESQGNESIQFPSESIAMDASSHSEDQKNINLTARGTVGTPNYMAPEVVENIPYGAAVDWWSYGICLFEGAACCLPYSGDTPAQILMALKRSLLPLHMVRAPDQLRDLVSHLLNIDPAERLGSSTGASEVISHPFFEGIADAPAPLLPPLDLPEVPEETEETAYRQLCRRYGGTEVTRERLLDLFYNSNEAKHHAFLVQANHSVASSNEVNREVLQGPVNPPKRGVEYAGLIGPYVGASGWKGGDKTGNRTFINLGPREPSVPRNKIESMTPTSRKRVALAQLDAMRIEKAEENKQKDQPMGKKLLQLLELRAQQRLGTETRDFKTQVVDTNVQNEMSMRNLILDRLAQRKLLMAKPSEPSPNEQYPTLDWPLNDQSSVESTLNTSVNYKKHSRLNIDMQSPHRNIRRSSSSSSNKSSSGLLVRSILMRPKLSSQETSSSDLPSVNPELKMEDSSSFYGKLFGRGNGDEVPVLDPLYAHPKALEKASSYFHGVSEDSWDVTAMAIKGQIWQQTRIP